MVLYDADFRRRQGERCFYGAIKDNYEPAKLLEASDREWLGKPQPPPARATWRSLFPATAKVARSSTHGYASERVARPHER